MNGTRVLVVDDEPQFLRALKTSLRAAGYAVETAVTGEEALTSAALTPFEAIILDLVLPDRSGTEVCRELRTWSTVPVILISARGEGMRKAALESGAALFLPKPFSPLQLLLGDRLGPESRRLGSTDGTCAWSMPQLHREWQSPSVSKALV